MGDLVNLVVLDLSSNQLTSLPADIATLPLLNTLNVSTNKLTTLPLSVHSSHTSSQNTFNSFFAPPTIDRASKPLPNLRYLLAADNRLVAREIPVVDLPPHLVKCDFGNNPLGDATALLHALSQLQNLKELMMEGAEVGDESFGSIKGFAALEVLDVGKTKITEKVGEVFQGRPVSWEGEGTDGGVRVVLGTRIKREAWEIEAERRACSRLTATRQPPTVVRTSGFSSAPSGPEEPQKESWEVEAEQGLLTEGGRRRARVAAALPSPGVSSSPSNLNPALRPRPSSSTSQNPPVALTLTQYYDSTHATLTLPRSFPRAHNRARSLAPLVSDGSDPTVPAPTLPLPIILSQPFAHNLRVLILANRRLDASFSLPTLFEDSVPLLPALDELRLEGCGLADAVPVTQDGASSPRKEPIFTILATLFPTLTSLDLSDNRLTSLAGVRALLIPDPARRTKGLKALRVRGNRLSDLTGLEAVAQVLKSEGAVEGWRLEELDLRDNEIAKLPPMLGYLAMDVLLVEGNTFRVPARRIWEREGKNVFHSCFLCTVLIWGTPGTKGLLTWLKDRVE